LRQGNDIPLQTMVLGEALVRLFKLEQKHFHFVFRGSAAAGLARLEAASHSQACRHWGRPRFAWTLRGNAPCFHTSDQPPGSRPRRIRNIIFHCQRYLRGNATRSAPRTRQPLRSPQILGHVPSLGHRAPPHAQLVPSTVQG
jgi:hypothetical protein